MGNSDEENVVIDNTSKLCEDISSLYLKEKFSDIILIVDGEKIHAHKIILAARSEYFESLLYKDIQGSKLSELSISNVSCEAFRMLLKYLYTGATVITPSNMELTLEVMGLAHQYSFKELEQDIGNKAKYIINLKNICDILNTANLYDLKELRDACLTFMDTHASEIVANDCFKDLTQISIIKILQRDSFFAPEIDIFKSAVQWCKGNNDVDNLVIQCVRLSWLTVVEIVSIVWPSKLVENEILLHAIAEIVDVKPRTSTSRGKLLINENIATPAHKAEVTSGTKTTSLLTGNRNVEVYAEYIIGDKNGITIKFGCPFFVNNIKMMLWDKDERFYHYYIEVSIDQKWWKKIIDYSQYACRSVQNVYFDRQVVQYVRVIGTHNTANVGFHLVYFEAYCKSNGPKIVNGVVCPTRNVATVDKKATVAEGANPNALLDGITTNYGNFTQHTIGSGSIVVQLAQPYLISSMKILLWDQDSRTYKYYVETSTNKSDWTIVADHRNESSKSWQLLRFEERPVVFIRITGTHNTANNVVCSFYNFAFLIILISTGFPFTAF